VVHGKYVEDCGDKPQSKFTLKPATIPYMTMLQYWLGKTKSKSCQVDPKCFQKIAADFFFII